MDILAFFTINGVPKTGLSPTIRIRNVSTGALIITDDSMTEVGDGFYKYNFAAYDPQTDYAIRCDGTSVLPDHERYVYAGNELSDEIDDINTNVLNLSASNPTTEDIANAVWSKTLSGGKTAEYILLNNNEYLKRAVGLMHENIFLDQPSYDSDNNLVSCRVRIYSDPSSVGTANNVIGTYQITATSAGAGKFTNWKQIRTS